MNGQLERLRRSPMEVGLFDGDRLVTVGQTMEILTISKAMVYRLIRVGKLERVKIGRAARITASSIERLIKDGHHTGDGRVGEDG